MNHTVYCPQCGADIWRDNILAPCQVGDVKGHYCPNCETCVPDTETDEQEEVLANMISAHPETTAEEADWENKIAAIDDFVQKADALIAAIDDMDALGIDAELEELRDHIAESAYQFKPDMDDHSLEDNS